MIGFGLYSKLDRNSPLWARREQANRILRDACLRLSKPGLDDRNIRAYRSIRLGALKQLEELEVVVRRQGRVASALLKSKSLVSVAQHFTVGFELETHMTAGLDARNIAALTQQINDARSPDPVKFERWVKRSSTQAMLDTARIENLLRSDEATRDAVRLAMFMDWAAGAGDTVKAGAEELIKSGDWRAFIPPMDEGKLRDSVRIKRLSARRLYELGVFNKEKLRAMMAEVETKMRAQKPPLETLTGRMYRDYDLVEDRLPKWDPKLLQVATDGSVRGFEIRTLGGLSVPQFVRAANIVFGEGVTHTIDTGCSFHIHVGVRGAEMRYDEAFQAALYDYLFDNIDKVPTTVQERWATIAGDNPHGRYFRPQISREKYSFVHYHERCHTWEFRCFGNVQSKKDAVRCLRLALKAMMYAYRVTRAGEKPSFIPGDWHNMSREIVKCVTKREPMSKVLAAARSL